MKNNILYFNSTMFRLVLKSILFVSSTLLFMTFLRSSLSQRLTQQSIIRKQHNAQSTNITLPTKTENTAPTIAQKETLIKTTNISKSKNTQQEENYQLEPCEDSNEPGCFSIKNPPPETMSNTDALNSSINNYRRSHNLNTLFIDPQICDIANQRALEISSDFSHTKFREHVNNGEYNYTGFNSIGENLWQGSFSAVHIIEFGWDKSEGHKANLQGDWTRGCAGIFENNAVFVFVK